jgi:hypothetical protein
LPVALIPKILPRLSGRISIIPHLPFPNFEA